VYRNARCERIGKAFAHDFVLALPGQPSHSHVVRGEHFLAASGPRSLQAWYDDTAASMSGPASRTPRGVRAEELEEEEDGFQQGPHTWTEFSARTYDCVHCGLKSRVRRGPQLSVSPPAFLWIAPDYEWQVANPACSSLRPATLRVMGFPYELLCVIFYGGVYGKHYTAEFQHGRRWYSCNDMNGDELLSLPGPAHAAQPLRDIRLSAPLWPDDPHQTVHTVLYTCMRHWTFTQRFEAHSLVTFSLHVLLRGARSAATARACCTSCSAHVGEAWHRLDVTEHTSTHGSVLLEHLLTNECRDAIFSFLPLTVPLHMW
jgi:hypothetical protein